MEHQFNVVVKEEMPDIGPNFEFVPTEDPLLRVKSETEREVTESRPDSCPLDEPHIESAIKVEPLSELPLDEPTSHVDVSEDDIVVDSKCDPLERLREETSHADSESLEPCSEEDSSQDDQPQDYSSDKFCCDLCSMSFSSKKQLNQHKRHCDKKSPECDGKAQVGKKRFRCEVCGNKFKWSCRLVNHMKSHTGERPHKCHVCGKDFLRLFPLKVHLRTHSGDKPYSCDQCDGKFTLAHHLKRHKLTHAADRPYGCDKCDARFVWRRRLADHLKTHADSEQDGATVGISPSVHSEGQSGLTLGTSG